MGMRMKRREKKSKKRRRQKLRRKIPMRTGKLRFRGSSSRK